MGSSLRVTPAADIPLKVAENGGKLVIVNLQRTPLDEHAALNIHAKCDDVMERLMEKLNMEIPKWKINRFVEISCDGKKVTVSGRDEQHNYYSLFPKVEMRTGKDIKSVQKSIKEPHNFALTEHSPSKLKFKLYFQEHYNEKPLTLTFDREESETKLFKITFDPFVGEWEPAESLF